MCVHSCSFLSLHKDGEFRSQFDQADQNARQSTSLYPQWTAMCPSRKVLDMESIGSQMGQNDENTNVICDVKYGSGLLGKGIQFVPQTAGKLL